MPEPAIASVHRSILGELVAFARRNTLSAVGGIVGFLIILMALTAPWVAPQDPFPPHEQSAGRAVPVRHGPGRARHALPRHLRRAHVALRRLLCGAARHDGRVALGRRVRLSRWPL